MRSSGVRLSDGRPRFAMAGDDAAGDGGDVEIKIVIKIDQNLEIETTMAAEMEQSVKACDEPLSPFFSHVLFPAGYDESRGSRGLCRIAAGSRLKKKKKRGRKGGAARDWLRGLFSSLASVACSTVWSSGIKLCLDTAGVCCAVGAAAVAFAGA